MKRAIAGVVLLAAIVGALAWLTFDSSTAPSGQPPLAHIDAAALDALRAEFNAASGATRIIVLLSPT